MPCHGSCHGGRVAFEVEGALEQASECNCPHCSRKGYLLWFVPREQLTIATPEAVPAPYTSNQHVIQHHVCPSCGCAPFGFGTAPDGAARAAINVHGLKGGELAGIRRVPVDDRSYRAKRLPLPPGWVGALPAQPPMARHRGQRTRMRPRRFAGVIEGPQPGTKPFRRMAPFAVGVRRVRVQREHGERANRRYGAPGGTSRSAGAAACAAIRIVGWPAQRTGLASRSRSIPKPLAS